MRVRILFIFYNTCLIKYLYISCQMNSNFLLRRFTMLMKHTLYLISSRKHGANSLPLPCLPLLRGRVLIFLVSLNMALIVVTNCRYKREAYRHSEFAPRILADNGLRVVMKVQIFLSYKADLLYIPHNYFRVTTRVSFMRFTIDKGTNIYVYSANQLPLTSLRGATGIFLWFTR